MQTSELEQHKHAILPETTHDEQARQQFVRSFKEHLVAHVHPGNRHAYENRVLLERTNKLLPCLLVIHCSDVGLLRYA